MREQVRQALEALEWLRLPCELSFGRDGGALAVEVRAVEWEGAECLAIRGLLLLPPDPPPCR